MIVPLIEPTNKLNPLVFLDIRIGPELVGRMIIELRKDVVPKTAENFRSLCTGELGISSTTGTRLHYRGCKFHKVQRIFMAQGGDIVKNNGTSGESIYGPTFEDENFTLPHDSGSVSMANFGRKDTNNSQFFMTTIDCSHLDGTNVVFGHIIRGFGILNEMEKYTNDTPIPFEDVIIDNCGEILSGENWNYCDNDETDDKLPPFPLDWEHQLESYTIKNIMEILNLIKESGNHFYKQLEYVQARRKYTKAKRYYDFFIEKISGNDKNDEETADLNQLLISNYLNLSATSLKLNNSLEAKSACNEVLKLDKMNVKALYRRGQAEMNLLNYEEAYADLQIAYKLVPDNKMILKELENVKKLRGKYYDNQRVLFNKLFK